MGMRVEEVALKLDICIDELIDVLENIDFEDANKDTELDDTVLKKLSKKYKVELKGTKKKKEDVSVSSIISKANEAEKNKEAEAQKRREIEEQERLKALEEAEKKKKEEQERKKKEAEKKKISEEHTSELQSR